MGPVSQYVKKTVATELDRHGVVVWYDEGCHFSELVDTLADDKIMLIKYTGSYYRLRTVSEELFSQYDSSNMASMSRLLVYVPTSTLDKTDKCC